MRVEIALDLSEDELAAVGQRIGQGQPLSLVDVKRWVRRTVRAALDGAVDEMQAMRACPDERAFPEGDLRIERWRATGSVADPANAVRILHVPSRIVVESSERGSFYENRRRALDKLRARLDEERAGICPICKHPANSGTCQRSHP